MKCAGVIKLAMSVVISFSCVDNAFGVVTYSFATFGTAQTTPEGINNSGQIVGLSIAPIQAFLYSDGGFTTFSYPGGAQTDAHEINNGGQIVGEYVSGGVFHGFVKTGDNFTAIDYPGAAGVTQAYGINDTGQIVGDFWDGTEYHGFLYSDGTFTEITHPSAFCPPGFSFSPCGTFATGINDKHQIVGYFGDGVITHGFLYSGGDFKLIDDPGASCPAGFSPCGTFPSGINNKSQIVGILRVGIPLPGNLIALEDHGFLYADGSFTTINDPNNPKGTFANGINDKGQIVGHFLPPGSGLVPAPDGFLATPIPSIPFASLKARLKLGVDDGAFDLKARFALGERGSIDPLTEPVTLEIGPYSVTIPAGSFKRHGDGYRFEGVIARVRLEISIHLRCHGDEDDRDFDQPEDPNWHSCEGNEARYNLRAEGRGANLSGIANQVAVNVSIGKNTGNVKVTADFE
jgi:probable HAF family extracellular repeat protein